MITTRAPDGANNDFHPIDVFCCQGCETGENQPWRFTLRWRWSKIQVNSDFTPEFFSNTVGCHSMLGKTHFVWRPLHLGIARLGVGRWGSKRLPRWFGALIVFGSIQPWRMVKKWPEKKCPRVPGWVRGGVQSLFGQCPNVGGVKRIGSSLTPMFSFL